MPKKRRKRRRIARTPRAIARQAMKIARRRGSKSDRINVGAAVRYLRQRGVKLGDEADLLFESLYDRAVWG